VLAETKTGTPFAAVATSELAHSPPLSKPRPALRLVALHLLNLLVALIELEVSRIAISATPKSSPELRHVRVVVASLTQ
jgi:hypothetical protein